MVFVLPNGEVFKCNTDLDRYLGLSRGIYTGIVYLIKSIHLCSNLFKVVITHGYKTSKSTISSYN